MDDIDKRLISKLQRNGRTSLSEIGKDLGMSHVAVSKRLDKLIKADIVKISAGINSEVLDTKVLFLGLETENMEVAEKIKKKYADCPRLLMFAPVTGTYNLFAMMIAEDTWSLESILGTCSMRAEPGIRKSETWFGNAPLIPKFLPLDLAPNQTGTTKATCKIDCEKCNRYLVNKCVGCPTTSTYKGTLWATPVQEKKAKSKSKS
ncbi:MAG: Lrp/AsnC family transcriptional regulator [Candidatus Thorarchaeota archaeon]